MSGHLTGEAMNGYARRALAPGELLAADDHLEACAPCRERISDQAGLKEAIQSLQQALQPAAGPDVGHLTYEQLETHAEGILGRAEREIIDAHLGWCGLCAAEARDFAAFTRLARAAIGAGPGGHAADGDKRPAAVTRRAAPVVVAPRGLDGEHQQPAPARSEAEAAGPEQEVARSFPGLGVLLTLAAAGLIAAVAAAWLVPAMLRRQIGDLTAQVDALRIANEDLSLQADQAEALRAELERVRSESAAPLPASPETAALDPAAPAAAVTLTDRQGPVGLDANGDLIGLDTLSVAAGRMIAAALRSGHAETPADLQDLIEAPGAVREETGKEATSLPIAPVATIVRDSRPTFSWQAQPGAASYTVAVYDAGFNPVMRSESLARTSWRPSRPLKRGGLYIWQVVARGGEEEGSPPAPPSPEARFKVLGAAESAALERALRDGGGSHLATGVLLARAGCLDDARKELQDLLRKNPDSPVARDLVKSLASGGRDDAGGR